jgi:hypothetical protein
MKIRTARRIAAGLALSAGIASPLAFAGAANASAITTASPTANASIVAGTLSFVSAPGDITFPTLVLTGTNQTTTATLPIDVGDNTGSGAGWNVTATSTQFTNGTNTLPDGSVTVNSAPSAVCDTGSGCTPAVESSAITYPYTLPEGATAPTATKIFDAKAGTGMGDQTFTPTFTLAVPAGSYSGTYTSTVTFSLVSAP